MDSVVTATATAAAAAAAAAPRPEPRPAPHPVPRHEPRRALHLDRVVGSTPELGPAAPEGGAGAWAAGLATAALNGVLPPLALCLGAVVVRDAAAAAPARALPPPGAHDWDGAPIWIPVIFSAAWSFTAPWGRTLTTGDGARAVATAGAVLAASAQLAAALLSLWATAGAWGLTIVAQGALAGAGCSLALSGAARVLRSHFRRRLPLALAVCRAAAALGLSIAPLALHVSLEAYGGHPWHAQLSGAAAAAAAGLLAVAALRPPALKLLPAPPPPLPGAGYELLQVEAGSSKGAGPKGGGPNYDEDSDEDLLPFSSWEGDSATPQPLFSEVDVNNGCSGANAVFVDEDPDDEDVLLFALHSRGSYRLRDEVQALCRPMVWAALVLRSSGRLGNLSFWLLAAAVVWERAPALSDFNALVLVSACGGVDALVAGAGCFWGRTCSPRVSARVAAGACVAAAIGCMGLGAGRAPRSEPWLVTCLLLQRVGLSAAHGVAPQLLQRAVGSSAAAHSRSLLDTLLGLCTLLAALAVGPEYESVFWCVAWLHAAAALAAAVLHYGYLRRKTQGAGR